MMKALLLPLIALGTAVHAQDLRDLCPTRPGLGTPTCVVDKGHVLAELGLADWTHEHDAGSRTDTVLAGDTLLRLGIDEMSEMQLGWTAYGHVRSADRASGQIDRTGRIGDVMLAYKRSLANPDGKGFSIAVQPYATLPVGRQPIGAGTWSAGLIVPMAKDLTDTVSLQFSPEIDAAPDDGDAGRHLAYGSVAGIGIAFSQAVSSAFELSAFRDDAPGGHSTELLAAASLAWQPGGDWQLDAGTAAGLNHASPDVRIYFGVARRF